MKLLKVGADPFPPYQYLDENGNIKGLDYEAINSIILKMGYEATYSIDEWYKIENLFNNKELDIIFQVQKTPEREKKWYFSKKLRDAVTSIVTTEENIASNNLQKVLGKNKKLGVLKNYNYGEPIESINEKNFVYFKKIEDLLRAVDSKDIEFGVTDFGVFNYLNKKNLFSNIKVIDKLNFNRPLYVVFNSVDLRNKFNEYLIIT